MYVGVCKACKIGLKYGQPSTLFLCTLQQSYIILGLVPTYFRCFCDSSDMLLKSTSFLKILLLRFFFLTGNKIQEISRPKHFSPTLYRLTALKYKFAKYLVLIVGPLTNKKFQRFVLFCHWNCCTRFQQIHGKLRYWVAMRFPLSTVCGWCFCTFQITWSIKTISKLFRFLSC